AIAADAAECVFRQEEWGAHGFDQEPWLGAAIFPAVAGAYVGHAKLGDRRFREALIQQAAFGDDKLFDFERGVSQMEGDESIVLAEGNRRASSRATIKVCVNGMIVFGRTLSPEDRDPFSMLRNQI